ETLVGLDQPVPRIVRRTAPVGRPQPIDGMRAHGGVPARETAARSALLPASGNVATDPVEGHELLAGGGAHRPDAVRRGVGLLQPPALPSVPPRDDERARATVSRCAALRLLRLWGPAGRRRHDLLASSRGARAAMRDRPDAAVDTDSKASIKGRG